MRATIEWSYELLSAREQRVFERLSVFAGGCTLAAAATICNGDGLREDDVLDVLSSLLDKSLLIVDFDGRQPRYRLLESFREYAGRSWQCAVNSRSQCSVTRSCVSSWASSSSAIFDSGAHEVWRGLLGEELDNWRAALQWTLIERGDVSWGNGWLGS